MSQFTSGIDLPHIIAGAAGGVLHNEALEIIDAILGKGVEDLVDDAPGSPVNGTAYAIRSPTGGDDFDGHDGEIAVRLNSAWRFIPVVQGVKTYCRAMNTTLTKGASSWSFTTGESVFFARLNADRATTNTSWATVQNWTEMQETGTDDLFDHNPTASDDGRVEVQQAGLYYISFSGVAIASGSTSSWRIGIGHNSATAESPYIDLPSMIATVPTPFNCQLVWPADVADDFYVSSIRISGTGTLTFKANSCAWYMRMIRP